MHKKELVKLRPYNGDDFNDVKDIANECSISNNNNLCRARH